MSNIVNVNVNVLPAAIPNTLQATGAIVSQGATTVTPGVTTLPAALGSAQVVGNALYLSQLSDLTTFLTGAQAVATMTWTSSVVTATVTAGHGYPTGQTIGLTIAGNTSTGYNGTFQATITSSTQFTYPLVTNPGTSGGSPVVTDYDVTSVLNKATEYFTQSNGNVGVYILEFGVGDSAHGIASLTSWLTANPLTVYHVLCPSIFASDATMPALVNAYTNTKACTYFYFDVSSGNYTTFKGMKSVCAAAISPNAPSTEKPAAAIFAMQVNNAPSSINKVPQAAYRFMYGLTAWPNNNPTIPTLEADYINYAATGAEGGLSNVILKKGVFSDGSSLNHWYAIDWVDIQGHQALANAVILGSNNTLNPLYYNQFGIKTLQAVLQGVLDQGVAFGLIGGNPIAQAIPYATYTAANPNDYGNGIYNGLYATIATQQGFVTIGFTVTISNLAP